ncbi:MAG TPA: NAD(P)/FAD-dependent oxidoreductase, partial [Verrucomicrobiae bacterium]|nr:NAD(P)/FAD-dependent oxidoreductase [Verrucomicrobiae bacterium]
LSGIVAWFMWAFVHVMALVSAEQRVRVFVQWAWKYFTRREGDRLITGRTTSTRDLREARAARGAVA